MRSLPFSPGYFFKCLVVVIQLLLYLSNLFVLVVRFHVWLRFLSRYCWCSPIHPRSLTIPTTLSLAPISLFLAIFPNIFFVLRPPCQRFSPFCAFLSRENCSCPCHLGSLPATLSIGMGCRKCGFDVPIFFSCP
jgi:hypothetical protein